MVAMNPDLCPCCGGLASIDSAEHSTTIKCMDDNCGVRLTRFRLAGPHREAALLAWNRRLALSAAGFPVGTRLVISEPEA